MRPRTVTISAPAGSFAGSKLFGIFGHKPMEKNGPTVCDAVGAFSPELEVPCAKLFFHGRAFPPAQNNVEPISECKCRSRLLPIKRTNQPPLRRLIRKAIINRIEFKQRITRKVHLRNQPAQQAGSK